MRPFITFLTPTYKRPSALARCLASVGQQTAVQAVEQIVLPDHVGLGVGGMFETLPRYAQAVHGRYVHLLADDDVLAGPTVVERVQQFADQHGDPPIILVNAWKQMEQGWLRLPIAFQGEPVCGHIDLGCLITRADVWQAHAHAYGHVYEGDYQFARAVYEAGHAFHVLDLDFLHGAVMRGRPE